MRFHHFTQKGMQLKMCAASGIFHLTLQAAADPQLTDKVEILYVGSCGAHVHGCESWGNGERKTRRPPNFNFKDLESHIRDGGGEAMPSHRPGKNTVLCHVLKDTLNPRVPS